MTLAVQAESRTYFDRVKARKAVEEALRSPEAWRRHWRVWNDTERYFGFTAPVNWHKNVGLNSTLYMIRSGPFVKVGMATDLAKRLGGYRLHNPHELSVICRRSMPRVLAKQIEKRVLAHLADHHHYGEWFRGEFDHKAAIDFAAKQIAQARRACERWRIDGFGIFMHEMDEAEEPIAAE